MRFCWTTCIFSIKIRIIQIKPSKAAKKNYISSDKELPRFPFSILLLYEVAFLDFNLNVIYQ